MPPDLHSLSVRLLDTCNLACSYCGPEYSSAWQRSISRGGPPPVSESTNAYRIIHIKPAVSTADKFWLDWPTIYPTLRHLHLNGGDPILDPNTYRIFEYLLEWPHDALHLSTTSNFSTEYQLFTRYLEYIQRLTRGNIAQFTQHVSIDSGLSQQAEYIKAGMSFGRVSYNIKRYLDSTTAANPLVFVISLTSLSVTGIQPLLEWILRLRNAYSTSNQRIRFSITALPRPHWQSLQLLPETQLRTLDAVVSWMTKNVSNSLHQGFTTGEIQQLSSAIEWARAGSQLDSNLLTTRRADFFRFFNEYDRRNSTSFIQAFPEMLEFWDQCRYHAINP
jgi:organic radical activating enzyme